MFRYAQNVYLLCLLPVFIILFRPTHVDAVQVECKVPPSQVVKRCAIGVLTPASTVTVVKQDQYSHCTMNQNYWLENAGQTFYLWVSVGCSGVFEVTTPASWADWGEWTQCSSTCGAGQRRRSRRCSTGIDTDCSTNGDSNTMEEGCNLGACVKSANPTLCGSSLTNTGLRIFGGQAAGDCQFPWMAMLYNTIKPNTSNSCGATIIDKTHVLTAAHCVYSRSSATPDLPENLLVYTGSTVMPIGRDPSTIKGLVTRKVLRVSIHPQFSTINLANDIAVLTLTEPIFFDKCHLPVCMISSAMSVHQAKHCGTMGWGRTSSDSVKLSSDLQWTSLQILTDDKCRYVYGQWYLDKSFCAGGQGHDACGGDSGGPVVCKDPGGRYFQYGIVSSGLQQDCYGYFPGQYTNVQDYLPWLHQQLA